MATVEKVRLRGEKRIVLSGISWQLYEQLRENEENWHIRMACDNFRLAADRTARIRKFRAWVRERFPAS